MSRNYIKFILLTSMLYAQLSLPSFAMDPTTIPEERKVVYERGKHKEILESIEKNKNDLKSFDGKGNYPLIRICENKSLNEDEACDLVTFFLANGAEVKTRHKNTGKTALHSAAVNNKTKIMKLLINKDKTIIDIGDIIGSTPLMLAASFPGNLDSIKLLIEEQANVNAVTNRDNHTTDGGKSTALHWAIEEGFIDYIKELIKANANRELKTVNGKDVFYFLNLARISNKITNPTYQEISKILRIQDTDELVNQLNYLNLDSNPNPLGDIILSSNISKVSEILNDNRLTQSQLEFGLKDAVRNMEFAIIALFKDKLSKENILIVLKEHIIRLQKIYEEDCKNLRDYKEEKNTAVESLLYFQEDQTFDLSSGDWADRAMETQKKSNFLAARSSAIPSLKEKVSSLEDKIKRIEEALSFQQEGISKLTKLIDFFNT